jgi:hypothetical protein
MLPVIRRPRGPAEAALETCDEAQRDAQSSSTRIREPKDRSAEGWRSVRRPFDGWEIPCIDGNDSEITVNILSANLALLLCARR